MYGVKKSKNLPNPHLENCHVFTPKKKGTLKNVTVNTNENTAGPGGPGVRIR